MIFAHLLLPAILFAICKAQPIISNNENQPIDEFRNLVTKYVVKMKDSCRVYDYLLDVNRKWTEDDVAPYGGDAIQSNKEFYMHTLLQILNNNLNSAVNEEYPDTSNVPSPNIIFNVMMAQSLLNDLKLQLQLKHVLEAKCCRDTDDLVDCLEKREVRGNKKAKFHSWGGKRDGKGLIIGAPRIVLRTPFQPWGGKRSDGKSMLSRSNDNWENM